MKIEIHKDFIVFEVNSMSEISKIEKTNLPYSIRVIEGSDKFSYITVLSFKNGIFTDKVFYKFDEFDNEIENIEYNEKEEIIRRVIFENYPNGETKWRYEYDGDGKLLGKEFFPALSDL